MERHWRHSIRIAPQQEPDALSLCWSVRFAMSQLNRVSVVRTDFPKKDEAIQMYVKLKGLKDKKWNKEAYKQKANKINLKKVWECTNNMRIPAHSLRAAHKIHPSFSSAILHIPITLLDIYRSIRKLGISTTWKKKEWQ
jgi:hypothetical protein